jgi:chromate transporter
MVKVKHRDLFTTFLKIGLIGFGGGAAVIPLIHTEVVDKRNWLNQDEFSDIIAITNTLPGPVQTKLIGYIGYRLKGISGLALSLIALIFPALIATIILVMTLSEFTDIAWVNGMKSAVLPVVGILMLNLTWQFFKNAQKSLGLTQAIIFMGISLLIIEFIGLHPVFVIVPILLFSLFYPTGKTGEPK